MQEIQGVPIRQAPEGDVRKEAARQLLESYYAQILTDGFFHADPHPGNLMWWNDKHLLPGLRHGGRARPGDPRAAILLLMAFWQEDVSFLTDVTLMLAGEDQRSDIDVDGFQRDLGAVMARYRNASLQGDPARPHPAGDHRDRRPVRRAPPGVARADRQGARPDAAGRPRSWTPTLDPFAVAGSFLMRGGRTGSAAGVDPKKLFYEAQKLRVRFTRLVESIERLSGSRPGPKLTVNFRGTERAGGHDPAGRSRRLALALSAGRTLVATAITASSTHVADWVPITLGTRRGALTLGLIGDLVRRR